MNIYATLEQVPLPDRIYNGPLEEKIVPLVKAVNAHFLTTTGSCEGHIDRFYPYPWVQWMPSENPELLVYLAKNYTQKNRGLAWVIEGNYVRIQKEAKNQTELKISQRDIMGFSQFLFNHRPEILDPSIKGGILRIPNEEDSEYRKLIEETNRLYEELGKLDKEADNKENRTLYQSKSRRIEELWEREQNIGEVCVIGDIVSKHLGNCLKKAKEMLE